MCGELKVGWTVKERSFLILLDSFGARNRRRLHLHTLFTRSHVCAALSHTRMSVRAFWRIGVLAGTAHLQACVCLQLENFAENGRFG